MFSLVNLHNFIMLGFLKNLNPFRKAMEAVQNIMVIGLKAIIGFGLIAGGIYLKTLMPLGAFPMLVSFGGVIVLLSILIPFKWLAIIALVLLLLTIIASVVKKKKAAAQPAAQSAVQPVIINQGPAAQPAAQPAPKQAGKKLEW